MGSSREGSDAIPTRDWLDMPIREEVQRRGSASNGVERIMTPITGSLQSALAEQDSRFAEQRSPERSSAQLISAADLQPTFTFTSSTSAQGIVKEAKASAPSQFGLPPLSLPVDNKQDRSSSNPTPSSGSKSPQKANSGSSSVFSAFRPSSPRISSNNSSRDDTVQTSIHQLGISRDRDLSQSGSEASSRNRRPSSVFEHVGGMIDRFGRKLQSRGEVKDDLRRSSNTTNGSALDVSDDRNSTDGNSPSSTQISPSTNLSGTERTSVSQGDTISKDQLSQVQPGAGLSWSPIVDEGRRRPSMLRNRSSSSNNGAADNNRLSAASNRSGTSSRRLSGMERTLIQITEDNERFSVVDVSGLSSAEAIKEKMMSKLHIFEEDPSSFAFSRTEIGRTGSANPVMNDDELLAVCWQAGDEKGTLKFLLHQTSPGQVNHSKRPPPPISPRFSQAIAHLEDSNTSAKNAQGKSGSLSSRSSLGDHPAQGEAAGDNAGGYRKGVNRRVAAPSNSAEGGRSPISSGRSPQSCTPLLPSVSEGLPEDRRTASTSSKSTQAQSQRADRRNTQSPIYSPNAEIHEREMNNSNRRDFSAPRPKSTHDSYERSGNGQWENDAIRNGQNLISPRTRQMNLQERPVSEARASYHPSSTGGASNDLPKSLQPGGRDPRGIDAADAAHMYLARTSSPGNEYATPQQQSALGIHNARSMDDMRKRSRMIMPPLSEMPTYRGDQHQPRPPFVSDPRHGSADTGLGHQRMPPPPFPPGGQGMQDPRMNAHPAGMIPKSRASLGAEIDRRGPPYTVPNTPYQQQSAAMSRPHFDPARPNGPPPRPNPTTSPQMIRPMIPNSLHPHPYDNRYSTSGPINAPSSSSSSPRPPHPLPNEFGARMQSPPRPFQSQIPPMDPRISRPHSTINEQQRYRPIPIPPNAQPRMSVPPSNREDHFTSTHFPASSPRMVSEFQRNPTSALQPGMTVQETMQLQRQQQQAAMQAQYAAGPQSRGTDSRNGYPRPPALQPHQQQQFQSQSLSSRAPPSLAASQQSQYQPRQQSHPSQIPISQHPPSHVRPVTASSTRTSSNRQSNIIVPNRPHTAAADHFVGPPTERSSGSSFTTNSSVDAASHRRNFSSEDRQNQAYTEETYSAPTSARSSRSESMERDRKRNQVTQAATMPSGRTSIDTQSPASETDMPYSNKYERRRSLEDEELLHLRPLPKVPNVVVDGDKGRQRRSREISGGTKDKDEDTFRAADWKHMLDALEADAGKDDGSGTAKISKNLLSPKRSETEESESSGTSHNTAVPLSNDKNGRSIEEQEEENGTFASFASFDDEDDGYDQGGTWAKPLDTLPIKRDKESKRLSDEGTLKPGGAAATMQKLAAIQELDGRRSGSPRRPVLTLSIDSNIHGSSNSSIPPTVESGISPKSFATNITHLQPMSSTDSQSSSSGPSISAPSPASSGINRRTSFARRDVDWAFRPPPEQLYDNLDAFFPKHDLDKPVLENSVTVPESPQVESPASDAPANSPAQLMANSRGSRFQHKKSIRIVAQDRKRFMEKADAAERRKAENEGQGLSRRRSTKLWGTKVVEMTSSAASSSSTSSDSPQGEVKPTFKWVKGDLIGKGTYGRVYLALNATTGEMIAVKQVELPRTDSDREDARQKGVVAALKSEIETLKDLDHPNIVSYLGFEETTSYLSIFLEYVPGGSVGSCLRKHGKLDEATIKSFLQQILAGLNYLHNRGILHRDLKADNLLVDFNGIVKISDFGTVRKSEDIYGNIASMSIQGSIFWMAPEVVSLSRSGYSAKVDIWSLGCVVLEMFAGRRPWSDEEAVQAMFKIGAERRAPPIPPDVRLSRAAAHFLKTCFAVDPNARPTAQRLLEHVFPHVLPGWNFSESSLYRALHR